MSSANNRIFSIDLLRGLVMMLMALDHVRDFFHNDGMIHDPLDLQTTTPFLFFTRFVTHYCAPTFIFLAGVSAYLIGLKKSKGELSSFLVKRGLWLILIELSVVSLGWTFDPFYHVLVFQVIWAIGISMVLMGLLVRLPHVVIFALGILIVFGHNLLDGFSQQGGFLLNLLHSNAGAMYPITDNHSVLIIYGFLPWAGIMFCGYGFGKFFELSQQASYRKKILLFTGIGLLLLFVVLRFSNGYGDPETWSPQKNNLYTFLAFISVSKYPASLLYTCITIGPALILLALFESAKGKLVHIIAVFGRVPFFYYILHVYLIHLLTVITFFASGFSTSEIISNQSPFLFRPPSLGFNLYIVYVIWIVVLLLLYPLCKWYNHYKSKHAYWWLSYL